MQNIWLGTVYLRETIQQKHVNESMWNFVEFLIPTKMWKTCSVAQIWFPRNYSLSPFSRNKHLGRVKKQEHFTIAYVFVKIGKMAKSEIEMWRRFLPRRFNVEMSLFTCVNLTLSSTLENARKQEKMPPDTWKTFFWDTKVFLSKMGKNNFYFLPNLVFLSRFLP